MTTIWAAVAGYVGQTWPQVVPNLWAALLCAVPGWGLLLWHHVVIRRHVRRTIAQHYGYSATTSTAAEP